MCQKHSVTRWSGPAHRKELRAIQPEERMTRTRDTTEGAPLLDDGLVQRVVDIVQDRQYLAEYPLLSAWCPSCWCFLIIVIVYNPYASSLCLVTYQLSNKKVGKEHYICYLLWFFNDTSFDESCFPKIKKTLQRGTTTQMSSRSNNIIIAT